MRGLGIWLWFGFDFVVVFGKGCEGVHRLAQFLSFKFDEERVMSDEFGLAGWSLSGSLLVLMVGFNDLVWFGLLWFGFENTKIMRGW